jgi:hypothetical protein
MKALYLPHQVERRTGMLRAMQFFIGMAVLSWACAAVAQKPIVYPAKGQSAQQQSQDEGQCYAWAKQSTGIDPALVASSPPPQQTGPAVGGGQRMGGPPGAPRAGRRSGRSRVTRARAPRPGRWWAPWRAAGGPANNRRRRISKHKPSSRGRSRPMTAPIVPVWKGAATPSGNGRSYDTCSVHRRGAGVDDV